MYIGDTDDGTGLHHMVYEVVDNSIDEALAGYLKGIIIEINKDGTIAVSDDGKVYQWIFTKLKKISCRSYNDFIHAGGKFDHNSYKFQEDYMVSVFCCKCVI